MPLSAPERIADDRRTPRVLALWRALQPLRSTARFMNSGAHPDDETSAMLAALTFRDGLNLSYVCANRGEGGQNDLGGEVSEDLGTVRTAEMERAADALDMRLYWLSERPEDTIFDFGFSKSGVETMAKWSKRRVMARFVACVRRERPDILCPTFLDIPGQHGHHRAMTQAAHAVMELAADPSFADCDLPVWQIAKLYLPAWSGAGNAYDDEAPPPPETVRVAGRGEEELSGWSWERIGQQSRWFHKTQGMGHWIAPGAERDWPLHLSVSHVGADQGALTDNLPRTLRDLEVPAEARPFLALAQDAIDEALAAFPNRETVLAAALRAHGDLAAALAHLGGAQAFHRVARKIDQLGRVIRLASGAQVRGWLDRDMLQPGETSALTLEVKESAAHPVQAVLRVPEGWRAEHAAVTVAPEAPPSDPYPSLHDPLTPRLPALEVTVAGTRSFVPLETPPLVTPAVTAQLSATSGVINLAGTQRRFTLTLTVASGGKPSFELPQGWSQAWDGDGAMITAPNDLAGGLYELPLRLDDAPAMTVRQFAYGHIAPRLRSFPAVLRLLAVPVALPALRIGYVGAGNDRVFEWLSALGFDVTALDTAALASPQPFDGFDSVVIGVFAFRFRDDLAAQRGALHAWVRGGGNLVTLYHRPWDRWDPDTTPPARLEIGQPSLRWRVTDEAAKVTHLMPDHPLLTAPNAIGPADWQGWHKERGLYFAKSWDASYAPLLEMADPDEAPHRGSLLSAEIGDGRHTHCALILHHQMEKLVPGAFRLMANLLAASPRPDPSPS